MTMRKAILIPLICCICFIHVIAQDDVKKVIDHRIGNSTKWLDEYMKFLALPNVYGDTAGINRNAHFILGMLKNLGLKPELLTVEKPLASPVVFAEAVTPGATRTIAFYAHYD